MATKLAPIITPALLSTIRRYPNLPRNTWYFVAATTLSIINRPDEIPQIYKHALDEPTDSGPGLEEQLAITRRIREALIKSAAVGGLPKVKEKEIMKEKRKKKERKKKEKKGFSTCRETMELIVI